MRVLLTVDGSEQSTLAAQAVAKFSSLTHLNVLHVVDLPRLTFSMLGPEIAHDMTGIALQSMKEEGEHILARTVSLLSASSTPTPQVHLEEGSPAELIMSVAQEDKADLIIMGARGKGQVQEFVLGSVSQQVLTHAHCPVFVVKQALDRIRHVLVAIQGKEDVERVAAFLQKHPLPDGARLTLLAVVPIPRSLLRGGASASEDKVEQALTSAEAYLDQAVNRIQTSVYQLKPVVSLGDPATTILEEAKLLQPDMLMVGVHHPSALTRFVLGSVSHTVIHHATHPILVFR